MAYRPALAVGGVAQSASAHCTNIPDPTNPPVPQPAALWPSLHNVLRQQLTIFSSEYCQVLVATHLLLES